MKQLLFFYAPWCPPCKFYDRTILTELERRIGPDRITRINADERPGMAEKHMVERLPTVIIKDGDKVVMRTTGGIAVDLLEELMEH